VRAQAWSSFGFLVVISTIVALLLANWLINRTGAARFSLLSFVTPLIGMFAGAVVLGDRIDSLTVIGASLVGVALEAAIQRVLLLSGERQLWRQVALAEDYVGTTTAKRIADGADPSARTNHWAGRSSFVWK
jgi:hypothetical protein